MLDHPSWQRLYPKAVRAEKDFSLLEPGDRILAGVSGGSDSLALLALLSRQMRAIGEKLGLTVVPGHVPGSPLERPAAGSGRLAGICRELGLELKVSGARLAPAVFSDCFRCSMARRRALFDLAEENGCNKIALGHNADDMVETFLLNALYSGRLAALNPRQPVLGGRITIIRPLTYVWKEDIAAYVLDRFGRIPASRCPGASDSRRRSVRKLLAGLSKGNAHLKGNLLKAVRNPRLEYLPVPFEKWRGLKSRQ